MARRILVDSVDYLVLLSILHFIVPVAIKRLKGMDSVSNFVWWDK